MARILTVDDSAAMRKMVGLTLKSVGHDVLDACDGREAIEVARNGKFDLVITDINMPNMDGISLVRALREMPEYRRTPLLLLTTESSPERKSEGKAAGATGWVVKPFNPERLIAAVSKCVG